MSKKYKHILSPLKVGNVILKSRLLSANALPHFLQGPELYPSDAVVDYGGSGEKRRCHRHRWRLDQSQAARGLWRRMSFPHVGHP